MGSWDDHMATYRESSSRIESYSINPSTVERMKVNYVLLLLTIVVSVLMGYLVYSVAGIDPNALLAGIISTVCFICTLIPAFAMKYETRALSVNLRTLSMVVFILMLIIHLAFAAILIKMPYYIIINGLILCVYFGIAYSINSTKQY